jgi:hypothetical protein
MEHGVGRSLDEGHDGEASSKPFLIAGDPSLELFGHGWTPNQTSSSISGYTGRHRAPEPNG